jgi:hypothetical protein
MEGRQDGLSAPSLRSTRLDGRLLCPECPAAAYSSSKTNRASRRFQGKRRHIEHDLGSRTSFKNSSREYDVLCV